MAGAAIIIGLQQLKGLLGISHFTNKTNIISVLKAVWREVHHPVTFPSLSLSLYISFSLFFIFKIGIL